MKVKKFGVLLVSLALILSFTTGCSKEGEAEKAGKEIDKAVDSAKDKFKELTK